MPNHCKCRLTVVDRHNSDALDGFISRAHGMTQKFAPSSWDIEREKSMRANGTWKDPEPVPLSFHALVPLPADLETKQYDPDGYDAEQRLWGVKWGAYDQKFEGRTATSATYSFTTAWGVADLFFDTIASMFPTLEFWLSYDEEFSSRGRRVWRDGMAFAHHRIDEQGGQGREWRAAYVTSHDAWVTK